MYLRFLPFYLSSVFCGSNRCRLAIVVAPSATEALVRIYNRRHVFLDAYCTDGALVNTHKAKHASALYSIFHIFLLKFSFFATEHKSVSCYYNYSILPPRSKCPIMACFCLKLAFVLTFASFYSIIFVSSLPFGLKL